jgi:hypothetical protein
MINLNKKKILEIKKVQTIHEKAKTGVKTFRKEFKKEMNTAIMAAFGFLIALVWKDVITEFVNNISEKSPIQGKLVSALIVTIICVLGIMLLSRMLKTEEEKKLDNL